MARPICRKNLPPLVSHNDTALSISFENRQKAPSAFSCIGDRLRKLATCNSCWWLTDQTFTSKIGGNNAHCNEPS
jgi:hypothetical protein